MAEGKMQLEAATAKELLRASAKAEKKLLQSERDAERTVLKAQNRLEKAQKAFDKARSRYQRKTQNVATATARLTQAQQARAAGPDGSTSIAVLSTGAPEALLASDASPRPEAAS